MKENIPLSWSRQELEFPRFDWIRLPMSGVSWIYTADVPTNYEIEDLYSQLDEKFSDGFLLRGCGSQIARYFYEKGCEIIRTGAEGVVDLSNLDGVPKSVHDLAARGSRWGRVQEIDLSQSNCARVSEFINQTPYASKTRLRYLFNRTFDSSTRCFVVSTSEDRWLGVLTISISSENSCHTEMILRKRDSPVGVMELLLFSAMNIYRNEGYKYFSLGEVPFISPGGMEETSIESAFKQTSQQYLVFKIGRLIRYAFNYKGLYDFKNKFNPAWKPVYICATPRLSSRALVDLFCETGYFELSRTELISNIKKPLQLYNE